MLTFFFTYCFEAESQNLKKSTVRGKYTHSNGDPARTIQGSDGSITSIPYLEFQRTTLYFKRFGRLIKTSQFNASQIANKMHGKWKLDGDTVILVLQNEPQKYLFREPVYLEQVDGNSGFQKD